MFPGIREVLDQRALGQEFAGLAGVRGRHEAPGKQSFFIQGYVFLKSAARRLLMSVDFQNF
jgi:hypothetical protein